MTAGSDAGKGDAELRIGEYLGAVDRALVAAGMGKDERASIVEDLHAQIAEMLAARAGDHPTKADVQAVLAEIDSPEEFAIAVTSEGAGEGGRPPLSRRERITDELKRILLGREPRQEVGTLAADAQMVLELAEQEARSYNHRYLGTEHVVLGLVRDEGGIAGAALRRMGVDLPKAREQFLAVVRPGPGPASAKRLPWTPRMCDAVQAAVRIAQETGRENAGTEHLLLGLLSVPECLACVMLTRGLGVTPAQIRRQMEMPG